MSKRKLSSSKSKSHSRVEEKPRARRADKPVRFVGISLGGGKTDKASIAVLEYYPEQKKLFLRQLIDKFKSDEKESADEKIYQYIVNNVEDHKFLAFDVPLQLPKCIRCRLQCPGYERCTEPEIEWMWKSYKKRNKKKRPKKLFTPYTERCVENYIATELEEEFNPGHAMGANSAPLLARALFLKRRLRQKSVEVYPKLSLWRIGVSLGIQKSYLRFHKHAVDGEEIRASILEKLCERNVAFLYHQDFKLMTNSSHCFDAFMCAFTAFLKHSGQCEKKPKGFPKNENWIEFPLQKINWSIIDE